VSTIHRAENVDDPIRLAQIFAALGSIKSPIILYAHPRLLRMIKEFNLRAPQNIKLTDSILHSKMLDSIRSSKGLITDSGGLQKEAFFLGVLCTTIRSETEWTETLNDGWNVLVKDLSDLASAVYRKIPQNKGQYFGNGNAANLITGKLCNLFG